MVEKNCEDKICCGVKIFGNVVVGSKGQIVIPNEVRKSLGISAGDSLIVTTKHGKLIGLIRSDDMQSFVDMMKDELQSINSKKE